MRLASLITVLLTACALFAQQPSDYRPKVHFSPAAHWINDPNGLVYFEGEYHLFYQYNPEGITPGHIGWGHAVSSDLLRWHELGVAIPAHDDEMIFTGSVVVDEKNTSGLCEGGKACLIAIYTGHHGEDATRLEVQEIAASQDRGRTWTAYSGNPVLDLKLPEFRDPGVSWNEETKSWLMVVSMPNDHQVSFYTSPDLKQWTKLTSFGPAGATGGQWECPDLLKISAADGTSMWALKVGINPGGLQGGSGEQYFLGSFDGKTFTQSTEPGSHGWSDYGKDSYCAISYNNLPAKHLPTLIGWMNNWQYGTKLPTSPFRGQMTMPREVTLTRDAGGIAMTQQPIVAPLRSVVAAGIAITTEAGIVMGRTPLELSLKLKPEDDADVFGVRLLSDEDHWTEIGFDRKQKKMWVDRTQAGEAVADDFPAKTEAPIVLERGLDLHIIVDRASVEVFAQGGAVAITNLVFPQSDNLIVRAFAEGDKDLEVQGSAHRLSLDVKPKPATKPKAAAKDKPAIKRNR